MLAQTLTTDLLPRLIEGAKAGRHPTRDHALIRCMIDTGARPCEVAAMTWSAFLDAAGNLTGRCRFVAAKRGAERDVILSDATTAALQALKDATPSGQIGRRLPVFLSQQGGRFHDVAMRQLIAAIAKRAALDCSGYSIRHCVFNAAAERAVDAGATVRDLAKFTGHRRIDTPAQYMEPRAAAAVAINKPLAV